MPDFEAIEVLTQAKERLFEHGWGTCSSLLREAGGDLESMCLEEAVCGRRGAFLHHYTMRWPLFSRVENHLRAATGSHADKHLYRWNDSQRSAGAVFDAIDRAIEIAKEASDG